MLKKIGLMAGVYFGFVLSRTVLQIIINEDY